MESQLVEGLSIKLKKTKQFLYAEDVSMERCTAFRFPPNASEQKK
jgi:hypothetical protein